MPGEMGEVDMMSFIRTHIESILKPYADNMCELHMTVLDLSSSVCDLQEKTGRKGSKEVVAARLDAMEEEQKKLMLFAESTRQFLDGFIVEESAKIDQEAKINQQQAMTLQSLQDTLTAMKKDIEAKTMPNVEVTLSLIKSDLEVLKKNHEDLRTKLAVNQETEQQNCVQLKVKLESVADNLKRIDEAQADIIKTADSHKGLLDTEIKELKQNSELEQRCLHEKFKILNDESTNKLKSLNERFEENQSQLKQYRKESEQAHDATTQSLLGIKDELCLVQKETQAKLDRIDVDLRSMVCAFVPVNLNERLIALGQWQKDTEENMKDVRRNLGDLEAIASKHEGEVAALQTATGVLPERVYKLEKEAKFTSQRNQRLEETLGLEPMDPNAALKKTACSGFLSEGQLQRLAWTAWLEAFREAKQNKIAGSIPNIQETLQKQQKLIESEKSKLHSTSDRVQSLEVDHTKLLEELQKLRSSLDLNEGHWKGMTRGLHAAKKTMHLELNALPPLPGLATSRPGSSIN